MARIILSKNCCDCEELTDPCAPCEQICCPYRAEQLGIGYSAGDLPDTLLFKTGFGRVGLGTYNPPFVIATRSGETYTTAPYTFTILGTTLTVTSRIYRAFPINSPVIAWGVTTETSGQPPSELFENEGPCLLRTFDGSIDNVEWRDQFLDVYNVITDGEGFTISRQSLCSWSGFDPDYGQNGSNVTLLLNPASEERPRNALWTFAGFPREDSGPYNSPVGTYSSSNYYWTVTP